MERLDKALRDPRAQVTGFFVEPRSAGGSGPRWLPAHVQPGTPTPTLCSPRVEGRRPSCSLGRLWERSA